MDPEENKLQSTLDVSTMDEPEAPIPAPLEGNQAIPPQPRLGLPARLRKGWLLLTLITYVIGLGSGYVLWGREPQAASTPQDAQSEITDLAGQINPQDGFQLPAAYGMIGPMLLQAGAIDLAAFKQIYEEIGRPLTPEQLVILERGSNRPITINPENQHFLLNLFWAFGLANKNPVLTAGPMMSAGMDRAMQMASTGGWSLAKKPVNEIYAHTEMITLTADQQSRLEEVAQAVFRPCCNNPTHFPDCNHGMAMLGLLELMASQNATTQQMFQAAKSINAFWFPQQTRETTLVFKTAENQSFSEIDARRMVGSAYSSSTGSQSVRAYLQEKGKLGLVQQGGGSCGVK